jgi:O-antigen/teichoic acid export membrane protein
MKPSELTSVVNQMSEPLSIRRAVENLNTAWLQLSSLVRPGHNTAAALFVQRVGGTLIVRVTLTAIGILTSVMIARLLGPEARGIYGAAIVLGSIGAQFGNFGLHVSNTFYVAKHRSMLPVLLSNSLCVSAAGGGSISLVLLLLFKMRPAWAPVNGGVLRMVLALIPVTLGGLLMQNLLLGIQQVKWFNLVDVAGRGVTVVVCGTAALLFRSLKAEQVVGIALLSTLVTFLLAAGRVLFITRRLPRPDLTLLRSHVSYGIRPYVSCLSAYAVLKIDVLMVKNMAGNAAAGYYSLASNMTDFIYMLPAVVAMMLFPALSSTADPGQRWNRARKTLAGVTAMMVLIALCAAVVAKPLTGFAYGKEFLPAVPSFLVLCCAIVFYGANNVVSTYFASCGQPWFTVWIWPASALLNIGLNLYCIARWGIVGAAISSLVTYSMLFLVQYGYAKGVARGLQGK